jgi:host factor-I protein
VRSNFQHFPRQNDSDSTLRNFPIPQSRNCFLTLCIYNGSMTSPLSTRRRSKAPPPGETGQEALYLRSLSDRQVIVQIKLRDGETMRGWIEYFDDTMLRLTREGQPNLFIYKHQIRSITEAGRKRGPRSEESRRADGNGSDAGEAML